MHERLFRPVLLTLDTSTLNARGSLAAMNRVEGWHAAGLVELLAPLPVLREVASHRCPRGRALYARKAAAFAGPAPAAGGGGPFLSPGEAAALLFPHTRPAVMTVSQHRDAELLSEHHRLGRDVLLTLNTRHFIRGGRRERLAGRGIRVMTPEGFVAWAVGRLGWGAGSSRKAIIRLFFAPVPPGGSVALSS